MRKFVQCEKYFRSHAVPPYTSFTILTKTTAYTAMSAMRVALATTVVLLQQQQRQQQQQRKAQTWEPLNVNTRGVFIDFICSEELLVRPWHRS
jgi:hypothetical protein